MTDSTATGEVIVGGGNGIRIEYRDSNHTYRFLEPPLGKAVSVTGALGIVDKSRPLMGWSSSTTIRGVVKLHRITEGAVPAQSFEALHGALKRHKLLHWQQTKAAGLRGTAIHDIAQRWIEDGTSPNLRDYPGHWWGYITALGKFLKERDPEFLTTEEVVGSAKHVVCGRLDNTARIKVGNFAGLKGFDDLPAGAVGLCDWKTSRGVYPDTHFPQLAAYEGMHVECGAEPTDFQAIVRLGEDGEYEVKRSTATFDDFLAILNAQRVCKRLKDENR